MIFTPAELPTIGLEFNNRMFANEADFHAAAFDLAPCRRHNGGNIAGSIGITVLAVQIISFLVGLATVVGSLYHRLRGRHQPS